MRRTGIVVLVIVLILVVGAELFLFARLKGCVAEQVAANGERDVAQAVMPGQGAADQYANAAGSVQITAAPELPPPAAATDVPLPTETPSTPAPTAEPAPTPIPATATPVPTAEPTPTAVPSSAGSCASSTGTALELNVDWSTQALGNGMVRVYVTGRVGSYTLDVTNTSVTVDLAGQSTVCQVGSILIGEDVYTVSDLFSTYLDVPAGTVGTLTVDWFFNGSYSGVDLPHIIAAGTVTC